MGKRSWTQWILACGRPFHTQSWYYHLLPNISQKGFNIHFTFCLYLCFFTESQLFWTQCWVFKLCLFYIFCLNVVFLLLKGASEINFLKERTVHLQQHCKVYRTTSWSTTLNEADHLKSCVHKWIYEVYLLQLNPDFFLLPVKIFKRISKWDCDLFSIRNTISKSMWVYLDVVAALFVSLALEDLPHSCIERIRMRNHTSQASSEVHVLLVRAKIGI